MGRGVVRKGHTSLFGQIRDDHGSIHTEDRTRLIDDLHESSPVVQRISVCCETASAGVDQGHRGVEPLERSRPGEFLTVGGRTEAVIAHSDQHVICGVAPGVDRRVVCGRVSVCQGLPPGGSALEGGVDLDQAGKRGGIPHILRLKIHRAQVAGIDEHVLLPVCVSLLGDETLAASPSGEDAARGHAGGVVEGFLFAGGVHQGSARIDDGNAKDEFAGLGGRQPIASAEGRGLHGNHHVEIREQHVRGSLECQNTRTIGHCGRDRCRDFGGQRKGRVVPGLLGGVAVGDDGLGRKKHDVLVCERHVVVNEGRAGLSHHARREGRLLEVEGAGIFGHRDLGQIGPVGSVVRKFGLHGGGGKNTAQDIDGFGRGTHHLVPLHKVGRGPRVLVLVGAELHLREEEVGVGQLEPVRPGIADVLDVHHGGKRGGLGNVPDQVFVGVELELHLQGPNEVTDGTHLLLRRDFEQLIDNGRCRALEEALETGGQLGLRPRHSSEAVEIVVGEEESSGCTGDGINGRTGLGIAGDDLDQEVGVVGELPVCSHQIIREEGSQIHLSDFIFPILLVRVGKDEFGIRFPVR
mmetsp:Transcript_40077/g.103732  ORF Transcript_40077/g.103732 Transcript_40077/m.103732 type:complete len:579 (+) Transcript_40077:2242-3978(+)